LKTRNAGFLNRYFYFAMSLLIAAIVVWGFSHTIDENLIHAKPVRPWILYLHGAVFSGWVVFFIVQSSLVRMHKVRVHRTLGWFGVALGTAMVVLGVSTAISMTRFKMASLHLPDAWQFFIVPLWDIVCFTTAFTLAILWRKRPEFHRRLMLVTTCVLTSAAFGRFPALFNTFYAGVDLLIFLGVVRDLIVTRRVHPVYLYALPALIVGQSIVMHVVLTDSPHWHKIANEILR
jgi:hypothetical protein